MKRIVFILLAVVVICSIAQAKYSGGSGDPGDPYQIATPADLNDIGNHSEDFSKSFLMTADIDMAGISRSEYRIIGGQANPFTGVFDGGNHKILNTRNAIFNYAYGDNVAIKNVGLVTVDVQSGAALALTFDGMNTGTISNCYVKGGNVTGDSAGGLIKSGSGIITNCYTTCNVQSTEYGAAGIVAEWFGSEISNCYSTGTITAAGGNCGGIARNTWGGHIYRCYSTGDIQSSGYHTGGLVGANQGTVEESWSTSSVTDTSPDGATGGLVGDNDAWMGPSNIINCFARGSVVGPGTSGSESPDGATGGLVGVNWAFGDNATIEHCYSTGHISGIAGITGGLIGQTLQNMGTASCIASFWDLNTSGQPTSAGGTGKTTTQMKTQSTYTDAGWIYGVWFFFDGFDYPYLLYVWPQEYSYSGGSGVPGDPYQINDVVDLLALAADANDYNKHFVLTADLDLNPNLPGRQVFTTAVIGAADFNGVFDGAGHKILNLTINTVSVGTHYLGLFGDVNGGEVNNLGIEDVEIISSGNVTTNCGGLAGILENGVIRNCYSTGDIAAGSYSWYFGGLVGENWYSGSIIDSRSTCNVTGADNTSEFGGLAGQNLGSISNCSSSGTITGYVSTSGIGGLVGSNGGYINNSFSTSDVMGGNDSWGIGGLAGSSDGIITDCFSTGSVAGGYSPQLFGGFVGLVGFGSISNCYSTGAVTGGDFAFNIGGFTGGLGEMSQPDISNCYSTGDVNVGNNSGALGGFIGQCQGNISYCYSTGDVNFGSDPYDDIGGFAGSMNFGGDIILCYYLDIAGPHNGLGFPLSDAQMKLQSSFAYWDFVWETVNGTDDIWAICEGTTYPKLAWQFIPGDSDNNKTVDFSDFAVMGGKWLQADSTLYCGGSDLTGNGLVNLEDLALLCDNWLVGL